jgi:hypothetical protein
LFEQRDKNRENAAPFMDELAIFRMRIISNSKRSSADTYRLERYGSDGADAAHLSDSQQGLAGLEIPNSSTADPSTA